MGDNPAVIFRGIVGSRAYGTANAASDLDVMLLFVPSARCRRYGFTCVLSHITFIKHQKHRDDCGLLGDGMERRDVSGNFTPI